MKKKNILLKLSGESLKGNDSIYNDKKIESIVKQIKEILKIYNIGIVIGGGNIWRGANSESYLLRNDADNIGMLATVMNAIFLKSALKRHNIEAKVYSSVEISKMTNFHNSDNYLKDIENNVVCIFSGGTGNPYLSTDTAAALRACEINAQLILMSKNGVDGLYDCDPNLHKNAKFIKKTTYQFILENNLRFADLSFTALCCDYNIDTIIFNIDNENSIINALNKIGQYTIITNKK